MDRARLCGRNMLANFEVQVGEQQSGTSWSDGKRQRAVYQATATRRHPELSREAMAEAAGPEAGPSHHRSARDDVLYASQPEISQSMPMERAARGTTRDLILSYSQFEALRKTKCTSKICKI